MHPHDLDADERAFLHETGISPLRPRCPHPVLLHDEVRSVLPADAASAVEQHLRACAHCRALAADLASIEPDAMTPVDRQRIRARVGRATVPERRRWPALPGRFAFAGGLALAAGVVLAVALWLQIAASSLPLVQGRTPAAGAPFVRTRPTADRVLALAAPAVELPPAAAVIRGSSGGDLEQFLSGIRAYRAGAYKAAVAAFESAAAAHPTDMYAWFYLGASRLLAGDAAGAADPLRQARRLGTGDLSAEATWYLSLAYERSGRIDAAVRELTPLCGSHGPRGIDACLALEVLSRSSR